MEIWSFSPLLLLFDTQFAGEHLGKKALLMPTAVLRAVAVLWFAVQHGSFPPKGSPVLYPPQKLQECGYGKSQQPQLCLCRRRELGEAVMEAEVAPSS